MVAGGFGVPQNSQPRYPNLVGDGGISHPTCALEPPDYTKNQYLNCDVLHVGCEGLTKLR